MSASDLRPAQRQRRWLGWLVIVLIVPLLAACGQQAPSPPLQVVATIAPLADWARQVGKERVEVTQIVPTGVDPETYQLTDADRRALAEAQVILCNGLGLEPWLNDVLAERDPDSFVALQLSDFVGPLAQGRRVIARPPDISESGERLPTQGEQPRAVWVTETVYSPYIWLDPGPAMAQRAVLFIGDTFTRADPQNIRFYRGNAERYIGELENLNTWVDQQVAQWPLIRTGSTRQRVIQVADRSWYYFARQYGITLRTFVNGRPTAAPSERNTPIFASRYLSDSDIARLPRTPDAILDPFASDSYIEMIRHNVEMMSQAMEQAASRAQSSGSTSGAHVPAP